MEPEDLALYRVDPQFAGLLGIMPPTCVRCGGGIKSPPSNWNGKEPLVHLVKIACERQQLD